MILAPYLPACTLGWGHFLFMSELDDSVLMLSVASGDRAALGNLYDRHAKIAFAVAARLLASDREAEDIVHDAFLEVWRRAGTFDPERASARSWILMIVRSRAIDRKRSAQFRRGVEFDESKAPAAAEPCCATDLPRVFSILADLPVVQREVIELGYFEGLSSTEMAERLQLPVGTVKSRVAAALARLRTEMGDA